MRGPVTPGAVNVIVTTVPPPGGACMSIAVVSDAIVGSPRPSPGESARGCIPRPLSVTTTTSSAGAAWMRVWTIPGSRSMNACTTEFVTASVTASARSISSASVAPCARANSRTPVRIAPTVLGSAGSSH